MLIKFDDKCCKLLELEDKYVSFFNSIAYEINRGNNYYYISKKFLEKLYQSNKLDKEPKEIYYKCFNNCSEDKVVLNSVNRKIVVIPSNEKNEIIFSGTEYFVPIDIFLTLEYSKKINIIGENNNDCEFLKRVANVYMNKNKISNAKINLDNQPGGGSTIKDVYSNKIQGKEISVLFVDTDKKYYGAGDGETYKGIEREKRRLKQEQKYIEIVEIIKLDLHEIENMIPINMIKSFYKINTNEERRNETIKFLNKFSGKKFDKNNPMVYFDMKKGIEKEKCDSKPEYKKYWKKILENNNYTYDENALFKGFGGDFLRKITSHIDNEIKNEDFYQKNINYRMRTYWNKIGKIVYSYGCAKERQVC